MKRLFSLVCVLLLTAACSGCACFKPAACGDGVVMAGEECDDGNTVTTDLCTNACKNAVCGDGFLGPGEACDDGNLIDTDTCSNTCQPPAGAGVKPVCSVTCTLPLAGVNCKATVSRSDPAFLGASTLFTVTVTGAQIHWKTMGVAKSTPLFKQVFGQQIPAGIEPDFVIDVVQPVPYGPSTTDQQFVGAPSCSTM